MTTHEVKFDSLGDFYAAIDEKDGTQQVYDDSMSRERWTGANMAKARETRFAWHEPFTKLDTGDQKQSSQFEKRWSDYDGEAFCPDRFYDCRPCLSRRVRTAGEKSKNGRIVTVYPRIGFTAGYTAAQMQQWAKDAMSQIDRLESQGYRCEVILACSTRNWTMEGDSMILQIKVKSAEQPLSMETVAAGMSPWFFRRWVFGFWDSEAKRRGTRQPEGRGSSGELPDWMKTVLPG